MELVCMVKRQRFVKYGRIVRIEWNRIKEVLNKD